MSRENGSSFRSSSRGTLRNASLELSENKFENPPSSTHFPPPRTPLNTIPDPSQCRKEYQESDCDSREIVDSTRAGHRLFDKRTEVSDDKKGYASNSYYSTPRVLARDGKQKVETNSAQSVPARNGARLSLGGGCAAGARIGHCNGGKGVTSMPRISSEILISNSDLFAEVQHFELNEDPSFWKDHNVQVFIRIRPLSTMERVSQGYGRCLKQENAHTLMWLGHPETRFTFDHVACETISQENLFRVAGLPMVENCLSGYNSCMFAYGQTGSGKTYTMMGEIHEEEERLNEDCGITPRIFEYVFSRIRMEEESRRDENLKFSCKCSFLEIYNEQITDLLEPSSTNLQLREDMKKGVYVENLTECNVRTVSDVLKLLLQGAANRKMAATHMNSESSRSHSVFTCIIESQWEKDSMTHFRFARLNLVDLAGSERQKSSGAEGDRLKEAANINKSLSTLGLVIMSLVDMAHGKHRHVPYRDSRLTFLLQDSLGGNSKTMVIANVSPSSCSANETLSTLKFAQRAKLIQNNAKVNEDASGDVSALQREIQHLKGQLSSLTKNQNFSRSSSTDASSLEESILGGRPIRYESSGERVTDKYHYQIRSAQSKKIKCVEATLLGALRREKKAETALQKLEAEIEHMNSLALQREEDAQCTKMMVRFREEKIKQLELLVCGSLSSEKYLIEENKILREEIQLLQGKIEKNPELTRFALENIRLFEQLQMFQNFCDQGERESLVAELLDLRGQLLDLLEEKHRLSSRYENKDNDTLKELEDCRNMNSKLIGEVDELRTELRRYLNCSQIAFGSARESYINDTEEFQKADMFSMVEAISIRSESRDEKTPSPQAEAGSLGSKNEQKTSGGISFTQSVDSHKELKDAKLLIEAMEVEQVRLINELKLIQEQNKMYLKLLSQKEDGERQPVVQLEIHCPKLHDLEKKNQSPLKRSSHDVNKDLLETKCDKLMKELEEARLLNFQYQEDQASQLSHQRQVEFVREQVEMETARTIVHLQEEVTAVQSDLQESLCFMTQENMRLKTIILEKEAELKALSMDWEKATLELTGFLVDGSRSLREASNQMDSIVFSFPQVNNWIGEHVKKAVKVCIEKEETILHLQKSLEDAQEMLVEMEMKLGSLKGATLAFSELQQQDCSDTTENELQVRILLKEKISMAKMLESKAKVMEDQLAAAEKRADASFLVVKWLCDSQRHAREYCIIKNTHTPTLLSLITHGSDVVSEMKDDLPTQTAGNTEAQIEIRSLEAQKSVQHENQYHMLHRIRNLFAEVNYRLNIIHDYLNTKMAIHMSPSNKEAFCKADTFNDDFSTLGSDFGADTDSGDSLDGTSCSCCSAKTKGLNIEFQAIPLLQCDNQHLDKSKELGDTSKFDLRKELDMACTAFNKINAFLTTIVNEKNTGDCSYSEEMTESHMVSPSGLTIKIAEADNNDSKTVVVLEKDHTRSFISKFEEAHATMKEADFMLNALVKANENAKELNGLWRQAGERLIKERASLVDELERLKSSIGFKVEENELLQNHVHNSLVVMEDSISKLEEYLQQMQREVENTLEVLYLDALSVGEEMLCFLCNSRSSLENMCSEIMEKEFTLFCLYQCHIGKYRDQNMNINGENGYNHFRQQGKHSTKNKTQAICSHDLNDNMLACPKVDNGMDQSKPVVDIKDGWMNLSHNDVIDENLSLKKELERKDILLEGLLFDISLLQESATNTKDIKDETQKLILALSQVRKELEMKTSQLDDLSAQQSKLENLLADTEKALFISNSSLDQANETINSLSCQNSELRELQTSLYLDNTMSKERLEEQKEIVKGLEKEILHLTSSPEKDMISSVEATEEDLRKVTSERDKLLEQVFSLNEELEMAYVLADEKDAIAVEARQESEASKVYADRKEEEVKILEHSVEELEYTINVLEKKVYEMDEEVDRHRLIRDSLELELQDLRQRVSTVEIYAEYEDSTDRINGQTEVKNSRQMHDGLLEIREAFCHIKFLEKENTDLNKEINHLKEYISELVLHSEAQASHYQQKFKILEDTVQDVQTNPSTATSAVLTLGTMDKTSTRTRGSSSPFRCITGLVQHVNLEKDQELSTARFRIEELETLVASLQKEVCMLNTRLAAAESMTHDVIRDLLGVKLDMTNYANLIDEHQVQKLVEVAHQYTEEILSKEQEVLSLQKQLKELIEERNSFISELHDKEREMLASQMRLEQLQERDQLLSAQNQMLKMDKANLKKKVAELDEMAKSFLGTQSTHQRNQLTSKTIKDNGLLRSSDADFTKRLAQSGKLLSRVNDELAQYRKSSNSYSHEKTYGQNSETGYRRQKD